MESHDEHQLFKKLSKYIPGAVYQFKLFPDGRTCVPYANEGIINIYGLTPDEVKSDASPIFDCTYPDDLEKFNSSIMASAQTLTTWHHEFRINHKDKGLRWLQGLSNPEKLPDGSIIWHGVITDITEKKEFERELQNKNFLLTFKSGINEMIVYSRSSQEIFEKACDIAISKGNYLLAWIGIVDQEKNVLRPVAKSGKSQDYLVSLPEISVLDVEAGRGPSGRAFRSNSTVVNNDIKSSQDYELWKERALSMDLQSSAAIPLHEDGKVVGTFNIYSSSVNYFDSNEILTLENISQSISFALDTLRLRDELAKSELKFRTIFNDAPMGIMLADSETGEVREINKTFKDILGLQDENVIGKKWMDMTHPDDKFRDMENVRKLREDFISSIKATKRYIRPDGTYVWTDIMVVKFYENNKKTSSNLVMAYDISDRITLEHNLKKAIHLKDEFIEIASHELKTPTSAILLQLQMIQRKIQKGTLELSTLNKEIDKAISDVKRMVDLVTRLLDLTELSGEIIVINKEKTNLTILVREVLSHFDQALKTASCEVKENLQPNVQADVDPIRMKQVISILIDNIVKYAPGCKVTISLMVKEKTKLLMIQDQGPGIRKELLSKTFKRFERLEQDRSVSGFGTGLYIAKQVVKAHGGDITLESDVGKGALFTIEIP